MACSYCGAELRAGSVFCSNCGRKLGAETESPEVSKRQADIRAYRFQSNASKLLCFFTFWLGVGSLGEHFAEGIRFFVTAAITFAMFMHYDSKLRRLTEEQDRRRR